MESPQISDPAMAAGPDREPRRARLFFALDPDDAAREALTAWREEALEGRAGLRLVAPEMLHVTLVFLGSRAETEIPAIAAAGLSSVSVLAAPVLHVGNIVGIPRRRPRLLALALDDPAGRARQLADAVSGDLASQGLHDLEDRPFWAHLTLARVSGKQNRGGDRGAAPSRLPPSPVTFDRVTLYRSLPGPIGPRYEPIERRGLAPAA